MLTACGVLALCVWWLLSAAEGAEPAAGMGITSPEAAGPVTLAAEESPAEDRPASASQAGVAEAQTPNAAQRSAVEAVEPAPRSGRANIVGRVVDLAGAPIEGVAVNLKVSLFPIYTRRAKTTTDARGRYRFEGSFPGGLSLGFRMPGLCEEQLKGYEAKSDQVLEVDTVTMSEGSRVRGRLRIGGVPTAGMQVWVVGIGEGRHRGQSGDGTTKADGSFSIKQQLGPGHYRLTVLPRHRYGAFPGAGVLVREFDLAPGQKEAFVPLDLPGK